MSYFQIEMDSDMMTSEEAIEFLLNLTPVKAIIEIPEGLIIQ